jgi:CysZ protein
LQAAVFLLARPRLWLLVLVPIVLNALLLAGLFYWGFSYIADVLRHWLASHDAWYWQALLWFVRVFFWVVVLVVVYFIFTPLALVIAAPFNDALARRVERLHGFGVQDARPAVAALVGDTFFCLVSEGKRLALVLGVFLLLLPLNLVPVVGNAAYVAAATVWAGWCAALEFTSYAADRRRIGFGDKWAMLDRRRAASFGFGLATVGLLLVPFVNVLMVAVSAVAGTMLFGALTDGKREESI